MNYGKEIKKKAGGKLICEKDFREGEKRGGNKAG